MNAQRIWSIRPAAAVGAMALATLILGFGGWAATARISGAVIAPGAVDVDGRRHTVQHPEGGLVEAVIASEGQTVDAGDILVVFDTAALRSEAVVVQNRLFEVLARKARLIAERDAKDEITFGHTLPASLRPDAINDDDLKAGQVRLFKARRHTINQQALRIVERRDQVTAQIDGLSAQLEAVDRQSRLIATTLDDQTQLLQRGLTQTTRVTALQGDIARLDGEQGALRARIAEARGQIAELEIERLGLHASLREAAISELRDLGAAELELRERHLSLQQQLSRQTVRAPVAGIVHDMRIASGQAVVRAADVMMYIVPTGQRLVISGRVTPSEIDRIHTGQDAILRLVAFNQRTTPEIAARVARISPDAFIDPQTGSAYYQISVAPRETDSHTLDEVRLLPGMPVETFIQTESRTPLSYLLKPIADGVRRAMREG